MDDSEDDVYVPPLMEQSDDYMIMHPKLEKNSIFIIHAHDGQPITDCIKKNLEMYTQPPIKVKACDVTVIQSQELRHQVTALLLTPEMMAHLEANSVSKQTTLQIPENTTCVCLVHYSMNTEDDDKVRMVLEKTIPNFAVCKKIKLLYLRTATIEIVTLLDGMSKENSFPAILQYRLEPDYIVTDKHPVLILFKSKKTDRNPVSVIVDGRRIDAKYLNPYTYSFVPSGLPYGKIMVDVLVGGKSEGTMYITVGNKMDLLYEEIKDMASPVEFLCQVLKLSSRDRETLDRELGDIINDRVTDHFSCLDGLDYRFSFRDQQIDKEFPTMLHFGAKYGLSCFCKVLSKVPGFQIARTIRNKYDQTPSQLAQKMKFLDLAEQLNPADTRISNHSMMREKSETFNNYHTLQKLGRGRQRIPVESAEVTMRPQQEKEQILKNRTASGLSDNSRDSGISALSFESDR